MTWTKLVCIGAIGIAATNYKTNEVRIRVLTSKLFGEPGRNRTCDPRIKSALLYQLSYGPTIY
jgi:hypothetical protein